MNIEEIGGYETVEMTVNTIVTEDVAAAEVTVALDDDFFGHDATFVGVGSSKRHPTDPSDKALGEALALSRAFADLATQLEYYSGAKIDEIQQEKAYLKARLHSNVGSPAQANIITLPAGAGLDN